MKRLLIDILILFSLMGCNSKNSVKTEEIKTCDKMVSSTSNEIPQIPENLFKLISDSLKGFVIPTKDDYDPKLLPDIKNITYPFFCNNDYDGNGEIDYGFLLKSKENTLNFYIFNGIQSNFQIINMGTIYLGTTDNGIATIITNEEKGDWSSFDTTIFVPNGGISLQLLEESRTRSYYWDGLKYERFFTD